jgi:hypothetical protein
MFQTVTIPKFENVRDLHAEEIMIYAAYKNPHVHFYWLVASVDPEDDPDIAYGYANLNNDRDAEWGDFRISEILDNKDNLGGQKIEDWTPCLFPEARTRIEAIAGASPGLEFMGGHSWKPPYWQHYWQSNPTNLAYPDAPSPGIVALGPGKDELGIGQYRKLRKAIVDLIFMAKTKITHSKYGPMKEFSLGGDPTPREITVRLWLLDLANRYPSPTRRTYKQLMQEIADRTATETAHANATAITEKD